MYNGILILSQASGGCVSAKLSSLQTEYKVLVSLSQFDETEFTGSDFK